MSQAYYKPEEVMKILKMPRTSFYREVDAGNIPSEIEVGRRRGRKFPKEAIDVYATLLKQESRDNLKFEPSTNSDLWARVQSTKAIYGDEDNVDYKRVLEWKRANNEIFMSVKEGGKLVGGVTIMPLAESTIYALISGKIREKDIPNWAIKKWTEPELSVYIPTIELVASGDKTIDHTRGSFLIRQTVRWMISLHNQHDIKNWYAITTTNEGEKLAQHLGFKPIQNVARKGYILKSIEEATGLLKRLLEKETRGIPIPHIAEQTKADEMRELQRSARKHYKNQ
ncbi:MAG: helix-turn-helix domain-containing protein [Chloroflexi bacterium]|nr:helix-turn-helix domain-containing protein [Chloroflexota bacterium]